MQPLPHRLTLTLMLLPLLCAVILPAGAATRVDTLLTMSDGVQLSVAYFLPPGAAPAGGFPGLVLVHGFAGSKNDYAALATRYADSGYFAVAYSVRGQGLGNPATASGGRFNWFTGERELEDCREVVEWTRSRAFVNGQRVGLEGISQGGLTSWGAAVQRMNIRCIVPIIGVPLYAEAMAPNGTENYFVVGALLLARTFQLVNYNTWCLDTLISAIEQDRYQTVREEFEKRDLGDELEGVNVPVFMQMAWQDDIFSGSQFFRAFHAVNVPKKLYVWPGQHAFPSGALEELRMALTFRFYRRWLRDDTGEGVMNGDSAVMLADPGAGLLRAYPAEARAAYSPADDGSQQRRRFYFANGSRLSSDLPGAAASYARLYVQNISNESYVFRSSRLDAPLSIVGADASVLVNSSGRKYQANVLLWDFDSASNTRRPITRGSYEVRLEQGEATARRRIEYELSPQLYRLEAGHQLEAWVKFGIPGLPLQKPEDEFGQTPYAPQETVFDTLFTSPEEPSYLDFYLPSSPSLSADPEPAGDMDAAVLPNPIRRGQTATVRSGNPGPATAEIFDLRGRLVGAFRAETAEIRIATSDLPPGVYTVRIHGGSSSRSGRFVVTE